MTTNTRTALTALDYALLLDRNVDRLTGPASEAEEAEAKAYAIRLWDEIELLGMKRDVMAAIHALYRMPYRAA